MLGPTVALRSFGKATNRLNDTLARSNRHAGDGHLRQHARQARHVPLPQTPTFLNFHLPTDPIPPSLPLVIYFTIALIVVVTFNPNGERFYLIAYSSLFSDEIEMEFIIFIII